MSDSTEFLEFVEMAKQGKQLEGVTSAIAYARARPDSAEAARSAFSLAVANLMFQCYSDALEIVLPHIETFASDAQMLAAIGNVAWVADEHAFAESCLKRAISLDRNSEYSYTKLVCVYLTSQKWVEAMLVMQAARQITGNSKLMYEYEPLVERLFSGVGQVQIEVDGELYVFGLSCFNGQAMDTDIFHCCGKLIEVEELRFLKTWLPPVRKIMECGCLVGNHSVYFLKNFQPKELLVFDACERSLSEMGRNIQLNSTEDMDTVVNCHHRAIAARSGDIIELLGAKVETISLADAITGDVDFVKIDIDGMELESLDGLLEGLRSSQAYLMIEVRVEDTEHFKDQLGTIGYTHDHSIEYTTNHNMFFAPPR